MDSKSCSICDRKFSNSWNRKRHERIAHSAKDSVISEDSIYDDDDLDSDHENTEDSSSEESTNEETDSSTEDESENDEAWGELIDIVLDDIDVTPYDVQNAEEFMQNPDLVKLLIKGVMKNTQNLLQLSDKLENTDLYRKINLTQARLMLKGYDKEEATEAAWKSRKFLLMRILKENIDVIQDHFDEKLPEVL